MALKVHCPYCDGIFPDPHRCPNLPPEEREKMRAREANPSPMRPASKAVKADEDDGDAKSSRRSAKADKKD